MSGVLVQVVTAQSDSTWQGVHLVLAEGWDMRRARQNGWEGKGVMLKMIVRLFSLCLSVCLLVSCGGEKPLRFSRAETGAPRVIVAP